MPTALETVVRQLTDSGVIAPGKLEDFVPPKATPKDGEELLRQLVQSKHLTKFQAQEIYQGRGKSLLLGNYTILDRIGAGGMGQVFKAEHRRMHRLVAIKMLPAALTNDAAALARFEREVTAAAKLRHPNVVAADDADEAGGVHFLVMEYVEGQDLSALVKKNGPFPVAKAINYILQAARGLEFAHGEGVVHRDIKPANLLLDKKGTVKILDMGLARLDHPGGDVATQAELTGTGAVMGTVDYMAPEQALNTKHADHRADIYSLGITLYYLVAGKCAYDGETLMEKLMAHQTKPIPSLKEVQGGVPDNVQSIFAKMVAKKKEDRYQSMTEVIADLERCQAGLSSSSASATVKMSSSSGTDESEVTAAFDSHPSQSSSKSEPEPDRNEPPQKNLKLLAGAGAAGFLLLLLGVIVIIRNQKGEEVGRMELPDGTSVEVQTSAKPDAAKAVAGQPNKPWNTPAFQQWVKATQTLPADQQIEAVSKKLMELNPGFDGKVTAAGGQATPKIENGVVTEFGLGLVCDTVADISPVRALAGLKSLRCMGSGSARCKLSDLLSLQGMQLTTLLCDATAVSDLSPLKGMPLTTLMLANATFVSDLSPLNGMKLTNLHCDGTRVFDLSPLEGMPLTELRCDNTPITDLSPLRGMPLTKVNLSATQISDHLSPLETCKSLKSVNVAKTKVTPATVAALQQALPNCKIVWDDPATAAKPKLAYLDPAFHQWVKATQDLRTDQQIEAVSKKLMELNPWFDGQVTPKIEKGVVTELGFTTDNVTDISPVRALTGLKALSCSGTWAGKGALSDLSPLRGMPLTALYCSNNQVSDLFPLKGLQLTRLTCSYAPVSDLSPLEGMLLNTLQCTATKVSDLSLLKGMPLTHLKFLDTPVSDLSPLRGMNLLELAFTPKNITRGLEIIRQMQGPITITSSSTGKYLPAAEFWKKYDAGEFGKPAAPAMLAYLDPAFHKWVAETQKLPAEQQIEAVSQKLMELNPGFDGKVSGADVNGNEKGTPRTENGVVTELQFLSRNVTDISPVRAFSGLKKLFCSDSQRGKLSSLSPLQGMNLAELKCVNTDVSDLSPLQGMPLAKLSCQATPVSDLSPLRGARLTNLNCNGCKQLFDLSPLQEMPLTSLLCGNTQVSDLSPLAGCKDLTTLNVTKTKVAPAQVAALQKALPNCKIEWDDPANALDRQPNKPWNTPAFQHWVKATQALPAEQQIEAVSKKLMELNPGFDGKFTGIYGRGTPKIENGVVTELGLFTHSIVDISPVQALAGLKVFNCPGNAKLTDLSPLQGLPLTFLYCSTTGVSDLSPLTGMPLTSLWLNATQVGDLSPLKGMPLQNLLLGATQVSDLSPLRGMQLNFLVCDKTQVSDLSPLVGMNLTEFAFTPTSITKGLDVIRQMKSLKTIGVDTINKFPPAEFWKKYDAGEFGKPVSSAKLAYLDPAFQQWMAETQKLPAEQQIEAVSKKLMELNPGFDGKMTAAGGQATPKIEKGVVTELGFHTDSVSDISPVRALPGLQALNCAGSSQGKGMLSDLSPLKGMTMMFLDCSYSQVTDLSPLDGMKLTVLRCGFAPVTDLSPLRGMPLTTLHFPTSGVSDLSLLEKMPLTDVNCSNSPISDLSPLKGLPLTHLNCNGTKISDLSPLKGTNLTSLRFNSTRVIDLSPLRGLPLTRLECSATQVSSLVPLEASPSLTFVLATKTQVTPASVAALQKALPNCKIEWDDPAKAKTPESAASGKQ